MRAFSNCLTLMLLAVVIEPATAAPPLPNDFDSATDELSPLYAYFGGVTAWGSSLSTQSIYEGNSLSVWANLQPDWASFSGFAIGTYGISGPELSISPTADTFSVTIAPPSNGQLSFYIIIREDDNNDGVIDVNTWDDEWETASVILAAGTAVYNFAFTDFVDVDPDIGNNVPNFNTTGRLAYILVFETYDSYSGGHVNEPVAFNIDHVGFFDGPQNLPNTRPADINGDSVVNVNDLLALLAAWGGCVECPEDVVQDGLVDVVDLLALLADWG